MILIINKNGSITQKNIKSYENLYSVCNYRNNNNFELLHDWDNEIFMYGKKSGRSGYENNYSFPKPIENERYYGTICIIKKINDNYVPITLSEWTKFYNKIMGISITNTDLNIDNSTTTTNIIVNTCDINQKYYSNMNNKELTYEEYESE